MNDNDIIKLMECCSKCSGCHSCPLNDSTDCAGEISSLALDIIKRQKAEIEKLSINNRALEQKRINFYERLEIVNNARIETIKEFAERLKELYTDECITEDMHCSIGVIKANIDDVAARMLDNSEGK